MSKVFSSFPTGRRLQANDPPEVVASISPLRRADRESVATARKHFLEVRASDFAFDGHGYWVDKGSGRRYRRVTSDPLASLDPKGCAELFFRTDDGDRLLFLRPVDGDAKGESLELGGVGVRVADPSEPLGDMDARIW